MSGDEASSSCTWQLGQGWDCEKLDISTAVAPQKVRTGFEVCNSVM